MNQNPNILEKEMEIYLPLVPKTESIPYFK